MTACFLVGFSLFLCRRISFLALPISSYCSQLAQVHRQKADNSELCASLDVNLNMLGLGNSIALLFTNDGVFIASRCGEFDLLCNLLCLIYLLYDVLIYAVCTFAHREFRFIGKVQMVSERVVVMRVKLWYDRGWMCSRSSACTMPRNSTQEMNQSIYCLQVWCKDALKSRQ